MNTSSIGKRIRKYREAKGWRQEDFAERIGLSVTYTGMIERGEKVPKLETFITIANALEVSADLLLADVLSTGYNIKSSEMTILLSCWSAPQWALPTGYLLSMRGHRESE